MKRRKNPGGRPPKSAADRLSVLVQFRLTEAQSRRVDQAVATLGPRSETEPSTERDLLLWAAEMRLQR